MGFSEYGGDATGAREGIVGKGVSWAPVGLNPDEARPFLHGSGVYNPVFCGSSHGVQTPIDLSLCGRAGARGRATRPVIRCRVTGDVSWGSAEEDVRWGNSTPS